MADRKVGIAIEVKEGYSAKVPKIGEVSERLSRASLSARAESLKRLRALGKGVRESSA